MHEEHIQRFWAQLGLPDLEPAQLEATLVDSLQVVTELVLHSLPCSLSHSLHA